MNVDKSSHENKSKREHNHKHQRKRISCPVCKYRIIDEGIGMTSTLHIMEEGDVWEGDYYTKCQKCNAEIGIRKTK